MNKPNIIMIILDAARQDMFGCYGNTEGLTPNIDKLAGQSVVFKNHYAAGCGSAQSHVSIFTGQHSERHKMVHNFCDLSEDIKTLPFLLKKLGYNTFGHMVANICPPAGYKNLFGFDELVAPGTNEQQKDSGLSDSAKNGSIKAAAINLLRKFAYKVLSDRAQLEISSKLYDGKKSLDYLHKVLQLNKGSDPIFAYTTLLHPHLPYCPPKKYIKKVFKGQKIDPMSFQLQKQHYAYVNGDLGEAPGAIDSLKKLYKAELLYVDDLIGRFTEKLEKDNLLDNSIFLLMSDHGEYLGEHGLLTHGNFVWDEVFNTFCIIRYPEKIKPGSQVSFMTSGIDIVPTLFGLIEETGFLKDNTIVDGIDIFEGSRDQKKMRYLVVDSPPAVLPERLKKYPRILYHSTMINRALRTRDYKYIWQSSGKEFLYKAGVPESDEKNIIEKKQTLAADLKQKMVAFYKQINPEFQVDEYPVEIGSKAVKKINNPMIRNELKKLGYLE